MRKKFYRFLLVVLGLTMAFLVAEISFRYYFYRWNNNLSVPFLLFARSYPEADHLHDFIQPAKSDGILFELKPHIESTFLGQLFVTNSKGLLGTKEFSSEPPPNTIRIAGVGDSIMSSWGVLPEETCLSVLENKLKEALSPVNVETLNFAVPGYNTAIEYEVIKQKVLKYKPDLIILGYVGNDMDLPNYIRRRTTAKSYAFYVLRIAIETLKTAQKPDVEVSRTASLWAMTNIFATTAKNGRAPHTEEEAPPEYRYMVGEKNYIATMEKIADLTRSKNVPVVVQDSHSQFDEIFQNWGLETPKIYTRLNQELASKNLPLTSVTLSEEDKHYNAAGHGFCADRLSEYLIKESPAFKKILNGITF